ncbi:MerR family transcriptional regulator [Actinomadura barringtoniae]|uniref:MerR family transcriptional regulator n=1 Tax=Actinomadura barringtoniae TaxID=1427535 RepID=A0A939TA36_9ACTN|nr:MerR family transcriptional regulator [Actinomadura barringtoniae]MBO2452062.1 MerR family transcriptional regulator [Actinomadura barringtoniae]
MFSIGEFARHGRVSVRMLRHYDSIGLLRPAHVDPASGYRSYEARQLSDLNRIVALKDLGFTLDQVRRVDKIDLDELQGMLRLRRAELRARIEDDTARLAQVGARLQSIEEEGAMPSDDIVIKRLPAVRVAELTAVAESFEPRSITPVIGPLYEELCARLDRAGVAIAGEGIAYYEDAPDGGVVVHAALPVNVEAGGHDFEVVDLPEVERAATIVHKGPMDGVMPSVQRLARWIDDSGFRSAGYNRELYIEYGTGDPSTWTTELQEPLR